MKRNIEIKVRFTEEELKELDYKVSLTLFSREEFMRRCIHQSMFKESAPNEFPEFIRLLRRLIYNAGQILEQIKSRGFVGSVAIRKMIDDNYELQRRIYAVYTQYEEPNLKRRN